ncbi:hypothetical protein [Stenotrophomonas indicatrix]|uniref:hypothetical protein n=1 Tax=Stenotrophomonas indicatrix TaxID=2045451 RepID=UPI001CBAB63A|nr:hypothetical protein [Stenotrophomonas indicatrix]
MAATNGLVWKIALGVFLGLSACGLVTCTVLGTMGYAIEQQREDQVNQAVAEFIKSANDPDPFGYGKKAEEQRLRDVERQRLLHAANQPAPLKPDERCVGKTRLQRVENGWVQSGSCP